MRLGFAFLSFICLAFADYKLTGTIKDTSGAVIPGARVSTNTARRGSIASNNEGRFELTVPSARPNITLIVDAEGFTSFSEAIILSTDLERTITLQPSAIAETIETVSRIEEQTFRVPFFVSTVTKGELDKVAPASLDEVLRSVPGLQHGTQGNAFTRVATRGQRDTADVLTLVDGVPLRQFNGSADLIMLPVQLVQEAEFVKGPASSAYGRSAIGGVMNFNLIPDAPSPEAPTGFIAASVASFNTKEGFGGGSIPIRFGTVSRGRIAGSALISASDWFQDRTGKDIRSATGLFDQTIGRRTQVRVNYLASNVQSGRGSIIPLANGLPLYGITREQNFGIPGARFDGTLNSITPRVDFDLGAGFVLNNTFNFNRYRRFNTGGITILPAETVSNKGYSEADTTQDTELNDTILTHRAENRRFRSQFLAGLSYENGSQDQASPAFTNAPTFRGPDYVNPIPGPNAANDPRGIRGAVTNSAFRQNIWGLYFQERFEFWRVGITGGLRHDRFDQSLRRSDTSVVSASERTRTSPRIGLDLNVLRAAAADVVLFGNYVEGFRPQVPALSVLNNLIVPQLLRPEVTKSLDTGLRARLPRGTTFQATYFHMRKVDGQRSFRAGPDDFFFVNATFRVKGVESEIKTRLGKHLLYANYSFQDSRHIEFRPTTTTNFSGFRVRMAPRHIAGTGGVLHLGRGFYLSPSWSWVGSRPLRDNIVNPQTLPSYGLFGLSASYDWRRWRFIVAGTNLNDKFYIADDFSAQNAGNAGVPRRVSLQVRYRF
jgi:outer membrane receptor protein involved in Fe transport